MIVKITFDDGKIMMFGNSYKNWDEQFEEYIRIVKSKPVKFETAKDEWIGWGGLKWCREEDFQHELNREGCQYNEEDNPSPRKFEDMVFVENRLVRNKVIKILKR